MLRMTVLLTVVAILATPIGVAGQSRQAAGSGTPGEDREPDTTAWRAIELTDSATGETFTLASLDGSVVVIAPFAVWSADTHVQNEGMRQAWPGLEADGVRLISIGVDPNESLDAIEAYRDSHEFTWTFVRAPVELSRALVATFGPQILAAPSTPLIILDETGEVVFQSFGLPRPAALREILAGITGGPGSPPDETSSVMAVPAPWTRVLDPRQTDELDIGDDRIVVPPGHELADVVAGDVISVGITDQTRTGLLRHVIDVAATAEGATLTTRQAAVTEAFESADVSLSIPLEFGAIESISDIEPVALAGASRSPILKPMAVSASSHAVGHIAPAILTAQAEPEESSAPVDVQVKETEEGFIISFDEVLADADDDASTTDDQITIAGTVSIDMAFELDLSVSRFTLEGATIAMSGDVATNLRLDAKQAGSFVDEIELFAIEFTPITVPLGPVPLVFRPRVPIVVGWDGSVSVAVDTSATTSTMTRVGIEYVDGSWQEISEFTRDFDFNPPAIDEADPASATIHAGPRFEFRLWEELAVASVGVEGTVRLDLLGSRPWACLYAGARAPTTFEVVGDTIVDERLFDFEELLVPATCEEGQTLPDDVMPVAGYSRAFGTCATDGSPVGEFGRRVAATDDGGVVVAAERTDDTLWVLRLDATGDVAWERAYPNRTLGRAVAVVPTDAGIVVGLEFGYLLFLDRSGDVRALRQLEEMSGLSGLARLPGGDGFMARGNVIPGGDALAELDADGTARWARLYPDGGGMTALAPRADGGWNVAQRNGYFFTVDAEGFPQQAVRIIIDGWRLPMLSSGSAGPAGQIGMAAVLDPFGERFSVVTLDADLDLVGATRLQAGKSHVIEGLGDGSYVVAGERGGLLLMRFSPAGAVEWAVVYAGGDPAVPVWEEYVEGLTTTSDGGIVAVGSTWALAAERCGATVPIEDASYDGDLTGWDTWVVKVPSTGIITPSDPGLTRDLFDARTVETTFELESTAIVGDPLELTTIEVDLAEAEVTKATVRRHVP